MVIPNQGNVVSTSSRRYDPALATALGANNGAPSKVPSPEDKLVKRTNLDRQKSTESIDFQQAIDPNEPLSQVAIQEDIDPDNAPNEAIAPLSNSFIGNETEHIKFARYDPFGSNGAFSLDLNGLDYCYPINGKYSSGYGRRGRANHSGVDLVAPALTPIYAVFDGTVRLSKPYSGYGNVIVVRHDNGLETVYAHNTKNLVRVGQKVARGEQIAQCGRTGRATTNHLHFEVRVQGATINPLLLINANEKCLQSGVLSVSRTSSGGISARLSRTGAAPETPILADNTPKAEPAKEPVRVAEPPKTENKVTATKPTSQEAVKANVSRGMRVGDQVYDVPKSAVKNSSAGVTYHTVASGQTMSGIARKYGTSVAAICKLNKIPVDRADKINLGQKLRVK